MRSHPKQQFDFTLFISEVVIERAGEVRVTPTRAAGTRVAVVVWPSHECPFQKRGDCLKFVACGQAPEVRSDKKVWGLTLSPF